MWSPYGAAGQGWWPTGHQGQLAIYFVFVGHLAAGRLVFPVLPWFGGGGLTVPRGVLV